MNQDFEKFSKQMAKNMEFFWKQTENNIGAFFQHFDSKKDLLNPILKPNVFLNAINEANKKILQDPEKVKTYVEDIFSKWFELSDYFIKKTKGEDASPVITPTKADRRFKDKSWESNPILDFTKQWHLILIDWMRGVYADLDVDERVKLKIDFFIRQLGDALSPSNFMQLNPSIIKETIETGGQNLLKGWENYLNDLKRGGGVLKITTTDHDYFELGKNLATTSGKVIFQNEIMQLIQYKSTTDKVYKVPLLIIPPWINKYYILDLQQENSLIKWLVDMGYEVFVVSWVNPDGSYAKKTFWDYMQLGIKGAVDTVSKITNERDINVVGYCLGGTLLLSMLAYYSHPKCKEKLGANIKSVTLLTTLTDFSKAGDLALFAEKEHLDEIENIMKKHGVLDGRHMFNTFSAIRANDMIWSYFINNYMMGKKPLPHDILFWNADCTNLPYRLHDFVLRKLYGKNLLSKSGGLSFNDVPIDLKNIKLPVCMISCKLDHIAPWEVTYSAVNLLGRKPKFILAGSGHIAGIVNHPNKGKYGHWVYDGDDLPENPLDWLKDAKEKSQSWWFSWLDWLTPISGDKKPAPNFLGSEEFLPIEDAPGSYVKSVIKSNELDENTPINIENANR